MQPKTAPAVYVWRWGGEVYTSFAFDRTTVQFARLEAYLPSHTIHRTSGHPINTNGDHYFCTLRVERDQRGKVKRVTVTKQGRSKFARRTYDVFLTRGDRDKDYVPQHVLAAEEKWFKRTFRYG